MRLSTSVSARATTLLAILLLLAACGSAGTAELGQPDDGAAIPGVDGGAVDDFDRDHSRERAAGGDGGDGEPGGFAAPAEQQIIKVGELTIEVEGVAETLGRVRAMAASLGGYVGGSQAGTRSDSATLTLRIPAARFDEALARIHELEVEVLAEATREQDVTGQVVDLEARIANLEASEESYRTLLARAERVDDILAVQARLDQVRGQIEQLEAQLKAVSDQAALATLTVTIVPRATPVEATTAAWDPGAQLNEAVAALVGIGQALLGGLIWIGVVWLPILLVLGLLFLVALRGVLEVRRRMPPVGAGTGGQPPAA